MGINKIIALGMAALFSAAGCGKKILDYHSFYFGMDGPETYTLSCIPDDEGYLALLHDNGDDGVWDDVTINKGDKILVYFNEITLDMNPFFRLFKHNKKNMPYKREYVILDNDSINQMAERIMVECYETQSVQ